jgi:hypothetical protein
MNEKQKKLLVGVAVAIFGMLCFPPYNEIYDSVLMGNGYAFILDMDTYEYVNIPMLMVQWLAAGIIGGILYFALKDG